MITIGIWNPLLATAALRLHNIRHGFTLHFDSLPPSFCFTTSRSRFANSLNLESTYSKFRVSLSSAYNRWSVVIHWPPPLYSTTTFACRPRAARAPFTIPAGMPSIFVTQYTSSAVLAYLKANVTYLHSPPYSCISHAIVMSARDRQPEKWLECIILENKYASMVRS